MDISAGIRDYINFIDLLVLSIGCNAVYFMKPDIVFTDFLKSMNIAQKTFEKIRVGYHKLTELIKAVGANITTIDHTTTDLENVRKDIEDTMHKYKQRVEPFNERRNLRILTLVCFLYAFTISILTPYKFDILNNILILTNVYLVVVAIILVNNDVTYNTKCEDLTILTFIRWFVITCLIVTFFYIVLEIMIPNSDKIKFNIGQINYAFTVFACFVGFLAYTISSVIGYWVSKDWSRKNEIVVARLEPITKTFDTIDKKALVELNTADAKNIIDSIADSHV